MAGVRIDIGSSALPEVPLAGGSAGTASRGWSVHEASTALARHLRDRTGPLPDDGLTVTADTGEEMAAQSPYARHAFGAHFAEVAVDSRTGEVRVRRMIGVFAAGQVLNSRTVRCQFIGDMIMGLAMTLTEGSTIDPVFSHFTQNDLASYHVPVCADVPEIEAHWIDEDDPHLNLMGSKGIGEIGIVGAAAANDNAVRHATGARLRNLPLTPDKLLPYLPCPPGEAWHIAGELMGMTLLGAQALLSPVRAEQGFREGFPVPSLRPVGRRVAQPVLPGHPKE